MKGLYIVKTVATTALGSHLRVLLLHERVTDEASTGTVTEGATSPTELTKGETKLDANAPEDGDITVQTKFDDGDDDYVSNVVGTS